MNHEEPDRVPIDLGGFQTGIHVRAFRDLLRYLGFEEEIRILDPVQQLAMTSESVLQRVGADIRYVTAHGPDGFEGRIEQNWRQGRLWHDLRDEFGVVWSMPDDQGLYMDISLNPLAHATIRDLENYPFPDGSDLTRFTGVREQAQRLRANTTYALSSGICGVSYEICWYMCGLERWLIDTIENPSFCEALIDRTSQFWIEWMRGFLEQTGDLLDVIMIGDDIAGQSGPLFSPAFYRSVVKPRQRRVVDEIRKRTQAKIWYHTCGSCASFIPDLLDIGIDILNPVQTSARNMEPAALKRRFGKRLVFWGGGIDAQHVLPFATPDRVRADATRNVRAFMPGGGYVFACEHNIQAGVPPQNILALFDAAHQRYRISST